MPGPGAFFELFVVQADIARGRSRYFDCRCGFDGTAWRCTRGWTSWYVADHRYSNQFSSVRGISRSCSSSVEDIGKKRAIGRREISYTFDNANCLTQSTRGLEHTVLL